MVPPNISKWRETWPNLKDATKWPKRASCPLWFCRKWNYGIMGTFLGYFFFAHSLGLFYESVSLWVYDIEFASSTSCPDKCWLKPCAVRRKKKHGTGAKWSVRCPSQHSGFGVRFTVGNCRCFHNLFQNVEFVDFEKIGCIMQSTSQWSTQQLKIIDFDVVPVFNTVFRV